MLTSILLQTAAAATTVVNNEPLLPKLGWELLLFVVGHIGVIWGVVAWKIKRNDDAAVAAAKEKEDAVRVSDEKLKLLGVQVVNQGMMHNEMQRALDKANAEHEKTRMQVTMLEGIPNRVAGLESKFDVLTQKIDVLTDNDKELKQELKSQHTEQRTEMRAFHQELISLIKNKN